MELLQQWSDATSKGEDDLAFDIQDQIKAHLNRRKRGFLLPRRSGSRQSTPRPGPESPARTRAGRDVLTFANSGNSAEVCDSNETWTMGIHYRKGRAHRRRCLQARRPAGRKNRRR